jgi:Tfp pilus assembly protein PilO
MVLAVVAVVAVFAAGWFVMLSPQKHKVTKLKDQAAAQLVANQKLASQVEVLKKQRSQIPAEQAQIAAIQGRLPDTPALAAYVRWLSATASAAKVELVSIAPSAPAQTHLRVTATTPAAPAASAPATTPTTPAGSNLSSIAVNISVNGDYYAIQQFLAKVESSQRATVVSSVSIQPGQALKPQSQGSQSTGDTTPAWQTLEAHITANIFVDGAPTAAATGGSAAAATNQTPATTSAPATPTSSTAPSANN